MSYFVKMFYVVVLLGLCFMAVSGIVKLTLANSHLIEGHPANLTCKTNPYQGRMYWKVDGDTVADCIFDLCRNVSAGSGTYTFVFDVNETTFQFIINPVRKDLGGQVIECSDGVLPVNVTLEVQEGPVSVCCQRCHVGLIVVVTALILGALAVGF